MKNNKELCTVTLPQAEMNILKGDLSDIYDLATELTEQIDTLVDKMIVNCKAIPRDCCDQCHKPL